MDILKIYKDKKLTQEIEGNTFNFGIVPAGEVKQFKFYVLNDSNAMLQNLEFIVVHNEVEVIEAPKELHAKASNKLIIEWKPSVTLKEGLKARLHIKGIELWG